MLYRKKGARFARRPPGVVRRRGLPAARREVRFCFRVCSFLPVGASSSRPAQPRRPARGTPFSPPGAFPAPRARRPGTPRRGPFRGRRAARPRPPGFSRPPPGKPEKRPLSGQNVPVFRGVSAPAPPGLGVPPAPETRRLSGPGCAAPGLSRGPPPRPRNRPAVCPPGPLFGPEPPPARPEVCRPQGAVASLGVPAGDRGPLSCEIPRNSGVGVSKARIREKAALSERHFSYKFYFQEDDNEYSNESAADQRR